MGIVSVDGERRRLTEAHSCFVSVPGTSVAVVVAITLLVGNAGRTSECSTTKGQKRQTLRMRLAARNEIDGTGLHVGMNETEEQKGKSSELANRNQINTRKQQNMKFDSPVEYKHEDPPKLLS
jgi:hypothetical protein